MSAQLVDAQETERRSISRELHDEVGQSLGALLVEVGRLAASVPSDNAQIKDHVDKIKSVAETTVQTVRNIALLLRPSMLDDLGLIAALEWQGREVSRRSEMEVEVQSAERFGKDPGRIQNLHLPNSSGSAQQRRAPQLRPKMPESPSNKRLTKFWSVFLMTVAASIRKGFAALAFWEWKSGCGAWEEFSPSTRSPGAAQR